eukprot:15361826-Ditylum_brightwellii.AAC.1
MAGAFIPETISHKTFSICLVQETYPLQEWVPVGLVQGQVGLHDVCSNPARSNVFKFGLGIKKELGVPVLKRLEHD